MHSNTTIVTQFYQAFQQLDAAGMQACYDENIVFNDPVFGLLNSQQTIAMWQMLCERAKDFTLEIGEIEIIDDEYITCRWKATYLFSQTGRRVTNNVKAFMRIQNGLITEHSDAFKFYTWSKQAFGLTGWLFGWSSFFHKKVQNKALHSLLKFMNKKL
ncbi:MAG: nuclear transport factor 2 family protein [Chitinophagaceae bacterium]